MHVEVSSTLYAFELVSTCIDVIWWMLC